MPEGPLRTQEDPPDHCREEAAAEHAEGLPAVQGRPQSKKEDHRNGRKRIRGPRRLQRHGRHAEKDQDLGHADPDAGRETELHHCHE